MDFSKNYLFKYGWKEGDGLGKSNDGMKDAIKPKLKFDKAGIGFDPSLEFTNHWWEEVYDNAAKKRKKKRKESSPLEISTNEEEEIDTKKEVNLSADDRLFKICGGRTAHKGARHGLKLNGKLQRLEEQEKRLADECSVKSVEIGGELPNERVSSKETDGNSVGKHESDQNAELVVDAGCTSKVKKRKLLNKST